jgi:exopolysaccharide biosynthesis protein
VVGNYSLKDLNEKSIRDAIVYGPPLIMNGVPQNNINNQGTAPRTAIGQRADGSIIFLVVDGRQLLKVGATIQDIQNIMIQENAINAINLDGGASSTMYYEGEILNNPSDKFGERPIPTIFYVK